MKSFLSTQNKDPLAFLTKEWEDFYKKIVAKRGKIQYLYKYLFFHPKLLQKVESLGSFLRFEGALPQEIKTIAILLIAKRYKAKNIWDTHCSSLPYEKLSLLQKKTLTSPIKEIKKFIDNYFSHKRQPKSLLSFFEKSYEMKGILELTILCGFYQMIIQANYSLGLTTKSRADFFPYSVKNSPLKKP